ncbi:hypothetical protein M422DRAFT_261974 [Sphaerobolus stellatus SS14]|uniref:FAD/NAD(P)-binding domain-containing protein n=1 Tax=Sphaerobolus stellatus (strain SS14) TaxID=990650 RepID=A0A0C9TZD2_SPHS4|nr:hypothetical protein M422DRAFT_261974 [Sphaerobolus stellatus SS14]
MAGEGAGHPVFTSNKNCLYNEGGYAFTYSDKHLSEEPLSPLLIDRLRGEPKDLPLAGHFSRDEEDEEVRAVSEKERLVVVGGGWRAVSLLNTLQKGSYQVVVVAPETFTTFTPLLPSAAVGTVQVRTLVEPLRKIIARLRGYFVQGKAVDIIMKYDKLVIAVGSSATHGVPGLENCLQFKTIGDAQAIRRRLLGAYLRNGFFTDDGRREGRLLNFVVCGGGPTGIEVAAVHYYQDLHPSQEIYDLCQEGIIQYYPKPVRKKVSIHVVQSRSHILNTNLQIRRGEIPSRRRRPHHRRTRCIRNPHASPLNLKGPNNRQPHRERDTDELRIVVNWHLDEPVHEEGVGPPPEPDASEGDCRGSASEGGGRADGECALEFGIDLRGLI